MQLVFAGNAYDVLRKLLLSFSSETCAILTANWDHDRLIVVERHIAPEHAYSQRGSIEAQLKPEFLVPIVKSARDAGQSVIFCHTHPTDRKTPSFSAIDDSGEEHLQAFLSARIPNNPHAAMVLSPGGVAARVLGGGPPMEVREVGPHMRSLTEPHLPASDRGRFDRQVRVFGAAGQAILRTTKVAIVGCGGTGSIVAQQLAYLGVSNFLLIDPDSVELSNLNRVVGATLQDVGRSKVEVAGDMIRTITPDASVRSLQADIRDETTARGLTEVDAIFSCTDTHASRAIINQIAYQYVIPAFDVGVSIQAKDGRVVRVTGRAQMLAPGLGCLVCGEMLDWTDVRRGLQTEVERAADHYIVGDVEPQPAVISLNSTMSSLTVTMFLAAFTGVPSEARLLFYDAIDGRVRPAHIQPAPTCVVCSQSGALAQAAKWPLPTRNVASA